MVATLALLSPNGLNVNNRRYIVQEPNRGVPDLFLRFKDHLLNEFDRAVAVRNGTMDAALDAYFRGMKKIGEFAGWLTAALNEAAKRAGVQSPPNMSITGWEVTISAEDWVRLHSVQAVRYKLTLSAESFALHTCAAMDRGVESKAVGLAEWFLQQHPALCACRYYFYDRATQREVIDQKTVGRTVTEKVRYTHVKSLHVHDVIKASHVTLTLDLARACPVPFFRNPLPIANNAYVTYVSGTLIREGVAEQISTEEAREVRFVPRYQPDPAILLGHYVLCGWK